MDQFEFKQLICDVSVLVQCDTTVLGVVTCTFNYLRHNYTFDLSSWSGRGQQAFLVLFLGTYNDAQTYGSLTPDGGLTMTKQQKIACYRRATRDVLKTVADITERHQRSVIDYAMWYRERVQPPDEHANPTEAYAHYITRLACHCIVHSEFMYGAVNYDLVRFSPDETDAVAVDMARLAVTASPPR